MKLNVLLTLDDDIVLSAATATAGAHRSLDYIPGSALLGAAARILYREFADHAYAAFHAGAICFCDGMPLSAGGAPGYPAPLSFHYPKGVAKGAIVANTVNRAVDGEARGQLEQWRNRQVTLDLIEADPRKTYRLRTAIEEGTDRAATGQLFGYEAIARGSRFLATLEIDETRLPDKWINRVREVFSSQIRVGRSRSSEYGRVNCEIVEHGAPDIPCEAPKSRVVCWALSDLALIDDNGFPTVRPDAAALGFTNKSASVDWTRTFLRIRRYAAFNAALGGHLREREVIERGSVITLDLNGVSPATGLRRIGMFREIGLGRLVVGASLLGEETPRRATQPALVATPKIATPEAAPALISWAKRTRPRESFASEAWAQARFAEAKKLYESAAKYSGRGDHGYAGPTPTQWGHIMTAATDARIARSNDALNLLRTAIFGVEGEDKAKGKAIAKDNDADWNRIGWLEDKQLPFRDWLSEAFKAPAPPDIGAVARLAKMVKQYLVEGDGA